MKVRRILTETAFWGGMVACGGVGGVVLLWIVGRSPDSTIGGTVTALVGFALIAALWWRMGGHKGDIDAHHNWILGLVEANGELRAENKLIKEHIGIDVHVRDVPEGETGPVTEPAMPVVRPEPADTVEMARAWDISAGQLDTRVADVGAAYAAAELEQRIRAFRERSAARNHLSNRT